MKKPLFIASLVLLTLIVPAALRAEDAAVAEKPKLSLEASLSGDDANPVLTVRLSNIGEVPVIVDKELVYMLGIYPAYVKDEKKYWSLQRVGNIEFPEVSELESRLLPLKPGEKIERQARLREGFEVLMVVPENSPGSSRGAPEWVPRKSGSLWQIDPNRPPTEVIIVYYVSRAYVDYVVANVKNVDAAQLSRNRIYLEVTIPYEFAEAAVGDEQTE